MTDWLMARHPAVILGMVVLLSVALTFGAFLMVDVGTTEPDEYLQAQLEPGWVVVYTEASDTRGRRIVDVGGCAILQRWDPWEARWQLAESRTGLLGGTRGLANAWCVP